MRHGQQRLAVGLYRVSTAEQGQSGLGLEAQQASVRAFCASQGWTLVAEFSDVASGKDDRRAGFQAALRRCRQLGAGWWPRGSIGSPAAPTRSRGCSKRATRSVRRTCPARTT
jgi:hypothetical protein